MRLFIILWVICGTCRAQFTDDFSDGDYHSNPSWNGDTSDFSVVTEELKLSAPGKTDTSSLFTSSEVSVNALWEFRLKMDFNPSSSNYSIIMLMADRSDFNTITTGYYVKIGGSKDEVSMYSFLNGNHHLLIDGSDNRVNLSNTWFDIKVRRDSNYQWQLWVDSSGNGNHILEGIAIDSSVLSSKYFGLVCRYTSSRSDKFYFDDIKVQGSVYVDNITPNLENQSIQDKKLWSLWFSESLDTSTLKTINFSLYSALNTISHFFYDTLENRIDLYFERNFRHGELNELLIRDIKDLSGNLMTDDTIRNFINYPDSFLFKSLLINEVMFKPTSEIKLPESEYFEIYNHSNKHIDLSHFFFSDLKDTVALNGILKPYAFKLLVNEADSIKWKHIKADKSFINLPTLNNDEDALKLISDHETIDSMHYFAHHYIKTKFSEGRSIELVNPGYICSDSSNWRISLNTNGGSPGEKNSRLDTIRRSIDFTIQRIVQLNDTMATFKYHSSTSIIYPSYSAFLSDPSISFETLSWKSTFFELKLNERLRENKTYTMRFDTITDCLNRQILNQSLDFISPTKAYENSIVINEILPDPEVGGSEFIEIYNASDRYFDLSKLALLKNEYDSSLELDYMKNEYHLIRPGEHVALTTDSMDVSTRFYGENDRHICNSNIPGLLNSEGNLYLVNHEGMLIDKSYYNEDFHFFLLQETKGISLERISPYIDGMNARNWTSASSESGYGSPGEQNSQYLVKEYSNFQLYPEVFSPDNDGYNDHVLIQFQFDKTGYWGNISIYNKYGDEVKRLTENEIFPVKGEYLWNGLDENGQLQPPGFYLVVMQSYHTSGDNRSERKSVVIANKFE